MRVLRENNDSLMAVLEAFVYDPLISWRLTAGQEPGGNGEQQGATRSSKILTVSPWERCRRRYYRPNQGLYGGSKPQTQGG